MNRLVIMIVGIALSGIAYAGPSTYVEGGIIIGGENGKNGGGRQDGLEAAGAYALSELWYVGGALGRYTRELAGTGGADLENNYLNGNGGRFFSMTDNAELFVEGGIWLGEQKDNGNATNTNPRAIEGKVGINGRVTDAFSLFGTFSLAAGDLDTANNDKLRDFIWSAGGAYAFTPKISLNVKVIRGSNGVNGQSEVARLAFRWLFK
jgi:hypothetical protein